MTLLHIQRTKMSNDKTPRTDAEAFYVDNTKEDIVPLLKMGLNFPMDPRLLRQIAAAVDYIEQLETELADAEAECYRLNACYHMASGVAELRQAEIERLKEQSE